MQLQIYIVSLSKGCFSLIMKVAQGLILFSLGLIFKMKVHSSMECFYKLNGLQVFYAKLCILKLQIQLH